MQVIDLFVDTPSKGGNLLLDIGPKSDGTILDEQVEIPRELENGQNMIKQFMKLEEVFHMITFMDQQLYQKIKTLFLYVRDFPKDGKIVLKGIKNKINRACCW